MNRCVSVLLVGSICGLAFVGPASAADVAADAQASAAAPAPHAHTGTFFGLPRGNRWMAASLSLGWNGLGQLYNEEPEKGYGMMAAWLTFPLAYGLDALTGRAYGRLFSYTVNVAVKGWSVVDAYQNAVPAAPVPSAPAPALPSPVPSHP